jgi:alcohol dehydrogenase (cytochrome c)
MSMQSGHLVINGVMYLTTRYQHVRLDAGNCELKCRPKEAIIPWQFLKNNRGIANLDGLLFRGSGDGQQPV